MLFRDLPKVRFEDVPAGSRCVVECTLFVKIDTVADPASAAFYAAQGIPNFAGWNAKHGHLHGPGAACDHGFLHFRPGDLVSVVRSEDFPHADEWFAWVNDQADRWPRIS